MLLGGFLDLLANFHSAGCDFASHVGGHMANLVCPFLDAFPGFLSCVPDDVAGFLHGVLDDRASFLGAGLGFFDDPLGLWLFFTTAEKNREGGVEEG